MPDFIRGGNSGGHLMHVDSEGRAQSRTVTQTDLAHSLAHGETWNVGTGYLTLTTANQSGVMYIKNTGAAAYNIDTYVFLSKASDSPGQLEIEFVRNPTGGTVISDAVDVTPVNMNFGSAKVPVADIYSGGEGKTFTGQDATIRSLSTDSARQLVGISTCISPGSSIGILITPPAGNTSMDIETIFELYQEIGD